MKQKDLALILVIIIVSGMISFFAGRLLFAAPEDRQVKAEVVDAITSDFSQPSSKYFNERSINPTKLISIGDNSNVTPFNGQ
jgi:hypothetical protein